MKQWWQQLNVREQKLVAAMGTVIGIFLLYQRTAIVLTHKIQLNIY